MAATVMGCVNSWKGQSYEVKWDRSVKDISMYLMRVGRKWLKPNLQVKS